MRTFQLVLLLIAFSTFSHGQSLNLINQSVFGGTSEDYPYRIVEVESGNLLAAGYTFSGVSGDITDNLLGASDALLVKFDENLNVLWHQCLGGSATESIYDIIPLSDGNYLIAGYSDSPISGDVSELNNGGTDVWVMKLDPAGNVIWQKMYGGNDNNGGIDVSCLELPSSDIIIGTNSVSGISGTKTEANK